MTDCIINLLYNLDVLTLFNLIIFDRTDFISKMQQNAPFCVLLKNNFRGGGGANPRPPAAFLDVLTLFNLIIIF
jgi:hypothetical protein